MEDKKLVTLIISMYKGEKYICECIESVLNQNYKNIELILIDDGSPDNCGKLADKYALYDKRIRVVHQENGGVSKARNVGLSLAKGEYVGIVDQDDVLSVDYVSYFMNLIEKYDAQIALVPTADKFFDKIKEPSSKDRVKVCSGEDVTIQMLYHKIIIGPWNKLIKRSLLVENNVKFNPNFFGGEGFAFSIESYQYADRVAVGNRNVYHYRVGDPETGASKFRLSSIESSLNAQQYILNILKKRTPALLRAWNFSYWHTCCDCLNIMVGSEVTNEYPDMYKKLAITCQEKAMLALLSPISLQQRLRGVLFRINPRFASKIINKFRVRKFKKA
ncbi:MAG: glycosyltransferase family 2 protein [Limosilactobacillus sp.]